MKKATIILVAIASLVVGGHANATAINAFQSGGTLAPTVTAPTGLSSLYIFLFPKDKTFSSDAYMVTGEVSYDSADYLQIKAVLMKDGSATDLLSSTDIYDASAAQIWCVNSSKDLCMDYADCKYKENKQQVFTCNLYTENNAGLSEGAKIRLRFFDMTGNKLLAESSDIEITQTQNAFAVLASVAVSAIEAMSGGKMKAKDPLANLDSDADGILDAKDKFPSVANSNGLSPVTFETTTADENAIADADKDGVPDASDNCPINANETQVDTNQDGIGDACTAAAGRSGCAINPSATVKDAGWVLNILMLMIPLAFAGRRRKQF
jgi:hypothetical protein